MDRRGFLGMLAALVVAPAVAPRGFQDFGTCKLHGLEAVVTAEEWQALIAGDSLSLAT